MTENRYRSKSFDYSLNYAELNLRITGKENGGAEWTSFKPSVISLPVSDDSQRELTPVDEALRAAQSDPKQANFFYDAFLNAEVFIPALRADKKPGEWERLKVTERFFPLYLLAGENRAVPVFDRLEKLKTWSQDRAFNYLVLQSHLLLRVLAPEVAIVLNEGTPYRYLFTPEILGLLRDQMKPVNPN
jgi:hypothetical protein